MTHRLRFDEQGPPIFDEAVFRATTKMLQTLGCSWEPDDNHAHRAAVAVAVVKSMEAEATSAAQAMRRHVKPALSPGGCGDCAGSGALDGDTTPLSDGPPLTCPGCGGSGDEPAMSPAEAPTTNTEQAR